MVQQRLFRKSELKILVQHGIGLTRNQSVVQGPASPREFGGARGVESHVGRRGKSYASVR